MYAYQQASPNLGIVKHVTPNADVPLGSVITYVISLDNSGDGIATGVVMTDILPSEVNFDDWLYQGSALLPDPPGDTVIWGPQDVLAGQSYTISFTAIVTTNTVHQGAVVTNTAQFNSSNSGQGSANAILDIYQLLNPNLSIFKSVTPNIGVSLGSVVTYTITLDNSGDGIATGVVMTDVLPPEVAFDDWVYQGAALLLDPPGDIIIWGPQDVSAGQSFVVSFTASVTTNAACNGVIITNTAEITSNDAGGDSHKVGFAVVSAGTPDLYEFDDACAQARLLAMDGAAQQHNFHQYSDEDWVQIIVASSLTYAVQATSTSPDADLVLDLYDACDGELVGTDDNAFSNDARLVFTATSSGMYYVKAFNHNPTIYGTDVTYELSAQAQGKVFHYVYLPLILKNKPAPNQSPEGGWQVYTNANWAHDLALEGGGVLGGGYIWSGTEGGVVCYSAGQQVKFTTADGLAHNEVMAVVEDREGRWWFGTYGGVSVLDDGGTPFDKGDDTWTSFTTADGLAGGFVEAIVMDSRGLRWFGTGRGMSVLDDGGTPFDKGDDTWISFTAADGLASSQVMAITNDGEGLWWCGTGHGVSVLDDGGTPFDKGDDTWNSFNITDGLVDDFIGAIAKDDRGRWWFGIIGTGGGVSVLDDGRTPFDKEDDAWISFTTVDGLADNDVRTIAVDYTGRPWFGTWGGGVSVLDYGGTPFDKGDDTWTSFTTADGLAGSLVRAIAEDDVGWLWLGTWGGGVSVLDHSGTPFAKDDDAWATFAAGDGLAQNRVEAIATDGGQAWFGTYGGVSVLDDGGTPFDKEDDAWISFTPADGLRSNIVRAIVVDGGGRLWFGTMSGVSVLDYGGMPFTKHDDTWTSFTTADGLVDQDVYAVSMDAGDRLWFGTCGGVSMLDHGGTPFTKEDDTWISFTTADGLADNRVPAITVDGEGRLWFSTWDNGVSVLDDGGTPFDKGDDTWIIFAPADGLRSDCVRTITVDSQGRYWFGGSGMSVLDSGGTPFDKEDDTWTSFSSLDGMMDINVYAVAVDERDRLWFGTRGGLSVLDHGGTLFDKGDDTWTNLTTADGLAGNDVNAIAEDNDGRWWFGTLNGVSELVLPE